MKDISYLMISGEYKKALDTL